MKTKKHNLLRLSFLIFICTIIPNLAFPQGVLIQESTKDKTEKVDPSAMLEIRSTDKGLLIPSMTSLQREAIVLPANGLMVFDTDEACFYYYDATKEGKAAWVKTVSGDANIGPGTAGKIAYFQDATTISAHSSVELSNLTDEPIFVVKNSLGQTVFAVYERGVRIYVDSDTVTTGKTARGGFAVGGFTTGKADIDFLKVTPDSVRVFINADSAKTARGGFAVGGFTTAKGFQELLRVTLDSTRIYIDDSPKKTARGGFAVGGFTTGKQASDQFFNIETGDTYVVNSEARILWYPLKEAFLAGRVLVEHPDSVGTNSWASGFHSKSVGNWSQALGYESIARGNYSTAVGKNAVAAGDNSFAFGNNTLSGKKDGVASNSYAIGEGARALGEGSYALGFNSQATGENSYAFGYQAISTGRDAFAFGAGTESTGIGSFAVGFIGRDQYGQPTQQTKATADWAVAIGMGSVASETGAFAIGSLNLSEGYYSLSMGYESHASGQFATALGFRTTSTAYGSVALGNQTIASGQDAVAMGHVSIASGIMSTATGSQTNASGDYSTAIGNQTNAIGNNSTAIGVYTTASGNISTAMGHKANATDWFSFAINLGWDDGPEVGSSTFRISGASSIGGNRAWENYSDKRLKKEIQYLEAENNIEKIMKLNGVRFKWKESNPGNVRHYLGFLAQEVLDILPEPVFYDEPNDIYSMEYTAIIPVLVEAVKEQQQIIEVQQKENDDLKARLDRLEKLLLE